MKLGLDSPCADLRLESITEKRLAEREGTHWMHALKVLCSGAYLDADGQLAYRGVASDIAMVFGRLSRVKG